MPIHIQARPDQIAPFVLLPGDPQRAHNIAHDHLEDTVCYNNYRYLLGYTGTHAGFPVSVQTTGMGSPSAAIVMEELIMLKARRFVRVGTCGSLNDDLALGDILLVSSSRACNGSTWQLLNVPGDTDVAVFPSSNLNKLIQNSLTTLQTSYQDAQVATMDLFYAPQVAPSEKLAQAGVLALEMESSVIFAIAQSHGLDAACLLVVSDIIPQACRANPEVIQAGINKCVAAALHARTQYNADDIM